MKSNNNQEYKEKAKRNLLLKTVGIPESKPWSIIIPPNEDLSGFSRVAYHEEFCKDYISKNEFDEIIDNVCKLASLAYSEKRVNDNKQLSPNVIFTFYGGELSVLIIAILSYYAAVYESSFLRIFSLVLLGLVTIVLSVMTLTIIFSKIPNFPSIQTLIKKKIDHYFDNINQLYTRKGFWWRIAPEALYIEMRIDELDPELNSEYQAESNEGQYERASNYHRNEEEKLGPSYRGHKHYSNQEAKISNRSKKKSNKVTPINTSTVPANYLSRDLKNYDAGSDTKSFQTQQLRVKNRLGQGKGELSRNESAFQSVNAQSRHIPQQVEQEDSEYNKVRASAIYGQHYQEHQYEPEENLETDQQLNGPNYQEEYYQQYSENISPEHRMQINDRINEGYQPQEKHENSMKMEELLGKLNSGQDAQSKALVEGEKSPNNKEHKSKKHAATTKHSAKHPQYAFMDKENSNFGTEWMSDA